MTRRGLLTLVAVLAVVVLVAVLVASSINSSDSPTHVMPGGETMQDEGMTTETTP